MVFVPREKSQFILFERTRLKKKGAKQPRRWNKTVLQKRNEQMKKKVFFLKKKRINKSEFSKKGINRRKHKRERE